MEAADVGGGGGERAGDLEEAVEGVVDDEGVGHPDPVGFHRVALPVVVVADRGLVEVGDAAFGGVPAGGGEGGAAAGDGGVAAGHRLWGFGWLFWGGKREEIWGRGFMLFMYSTVI